MDCRFPSSFPGGVRLVFFPEKDMVVFLTERRISINPRMGSIKTFCSPTSVTLFVNGATGQSP